MIDTFQKKLNPDFTILETVKYSQGVESVTISRARLLRMISAISLLPRTLFAKIIVVLALVTGLQFVTSLVLASQLLWRSIAETAQYQSQGIANDIANESAPILNPSGEAEVD